MKNQSYLISIVYASKIYGIPKGKLYTAARNKDPEVPIFVRIGTFTKVNTILLEKLLNEKASKHEQLF